ncbi:MAG: MarR family transcriptional regulator [Methanocorpusculum sp.]|uniref:MarR family winged helix-turn-helix transcriptional regulator n=1 Tax=Methanocorpusculum sp. TaxID=2058474 RepID=UPI0027177AF7|nr:MarR family transcriptional regulator [Methanocorpusculum sp.]MDO9522221.1 MarR family transcriptional regulator [Methanocorpusculum sp.]
MDDRLPIAILIKILSNYIKRNLDSAAAQGPLKNITGTQIQIIGYIYHEAKSDVFQKDIETKYSIRRSTATGILQLMEKNGLITREPVDYDARLKKIVLTEKAHTISKQAKLNVFELEKRLTKGISTEELAVFRSIIWKMKVNLEEQV